MSPLIANPSLLQRAGCFFCGLIVLFSGSLLADEAPPFRTDTSDDESLPWFQLVPGEFPPAGSAHAISGELIQIDHLQRQFVLRVDRTDKQNRSHFDLPLQATMLPFGSIFYQGAPAALEDIPLGTHLHGQFYLKDPSDESPPLYGPNGRFTPEADFNRCFQLEDDFSYHARQKQLWKINAIDRSEMKLTATLQQGGKAIGDPTIFDLQESTRVWSGNSVEGLETLAKDQQILFNLTWATLYGPGRILEIWIDEAARKLATSQQLKRHQIYIRQRGLPGWIDAVDNQHRILNITFFSGIDPSLFQALTKDEPAGIAVAKDNLGTYDPVNDRKRGPILNIHQSEAGPGNSGYTIEVQPDLLLEGYRPKRIVRVYPGSWPVIALPKEEQWFGR